MDDDVASKTAVKVNDATPAEVLPNRIDDQEVSAKKSDCMIIDENGVVREEVQFQDFDIQVVKDSESESSDDDDTNTYVGYTPSSDFEEDLREPLIDIDTLKASDEIWLIQIPLRIPLDDFESQKVQLELDNEDGHIGNIETNYGEVYKMVEFPSPVASDITVFASSPTGVTIAGTIKRHVNLVRFPEPEDLSSNDEAFNPKADSDSVESSSNSLDSFGPKNKSYIEISSSSDPSESGHYTASDESLQVLDCGKRNFKKPNKSRRKK